MNLLRTFLRLPLVLVVVVGCGSPSPKDLKAPRPNQEPSPETPLVFNVDVSHPLPLVSLVATAEEAARLRAQYASFLIEMGPREPGGVLSLRFDKKGSLGNPWNFYLRNYSPPYPVRLIGVLSDGRKEVLHEEIYQ